MRFIVIFILCMLPRPMSAQAMDPEIAVFSSGEGVWIVACGSSVCVGRNNWFELRFEAGELFITSISGERILHLQKRFAQTLPTDVALNDYAIETLRSEGRLVRLSDSDAAIPRLKGISTQGLAETLNFMSEELALDVDRSAQDYRAIAQERFETGNVPHNLPFTKPQIEFAIRSQTTGE